jgi:hypothetical protein
MVGLQGRKELRAALAGIKGTIVKDKFRMEASSGQPAHAGGNSPLGRDDRGWPASYERVGESGGGEKM